MTCRHLLPLSWYVRGHLEHPYMHQMQWRDRLAQRDSCRTIDWPNYFPIDFLASWVAQDPHEQYQMSGLEPYASDYRGKLFCTQKSCDICSLHRHWDWIASVCLCLLFFWSSRILPNGFHYPIWSENPPNLKMVMHLQMLYLQSNHPCVIYGQISTTVLIVNSICPW